jgi:hypothetical protein
MSCEINWERCGYLFLLRAFGADDLAGEFFNRNAGGARQFQRIDESFDLPFLDPQIDRLARVAIDRAVNLLNG